jgi:hypothetical protein
MVVRRLPCRLKNCPKCGLRRTRRTVSVQAMPADGP